MTPLSKAGLSGSAFMLWADGQTRSSAWLEPLRKTIKTILIAIREFKINDLSLRSAALTYTVMLSLVPILAMSTAIVKGLGGGDQLKDAAYSYLETLEENHTPPAATDENPPADESTEGQNSSTMTGHLRQALDTLFAYVDNTNFAALGSVGIIGVLVSVLMVFGHIEQALNRIWKVTKKRPLLRKVADYITIMVLMPFSINIAFAASAFLKNQTLATKIEIILPFDWLQALILKLVPIVFITLTFYVIYLFFPNKRVKQLPALLGALVAASLWFGVQNVYITMQVGVANYNAIYGSFASLPLFLVWMYIGWIFILCGAQLAYAAQNMASYRLVPHTPVPSLRLSAAFDALECIRKGYRERATVTAETVAESYPEYDTDLVKGVIKDLAKGNCVIYAADKERLLPAAPPQVIEHREIVELILGTETPETEGGETSTAILQSAGTTDATNEKKKEPTSVVGNPD